MRAGTRPPKKKGPFPAQGREGTVDKSQAAARRAAAPPPVKLEIEAETELEDAWIEFFCDQAE
jgi:hypothetical protein